MLGCTGLCPSAIVRFAKTRIASNTLFIITITSPGHSRSMLFTMSRTVHYLSAFAFVIAGLPLLAQPAAATSPAQPPPLPRVVSPELHSDATVTFRFRDPNAKEVL